MAYREVLSVEIREIIRRWQAGLSQRRIARGTGLSRQTVRRCQQRYIDAAEEAGLRPCQQRSESDPDQRPDVDPLRRHDRC